MDATVRGDRRWQRVLVLAAAVGFVETVLFAALAPLLPELEDDLGLSKVGAGALTSAYAVGAFLGALPSVWVARRVGVKATVIVGLALLAVSSIAFAYPDSSTVVFIARFGQGLGSAFAYTGALAWLTTVAPPARRAEAIGMVFAAAFSGALVGPLLGATADSIGTEAVFAGVALVAVALAVVAALGSAPAVDAGSTGSLLVLAREPGVRLGVWLIVLVGLLLGVVGVLAPLRLDELGWGALGIGLVFALGGVLQAVVNPVAGRTADRRGRVAPLRVGLLGSAIASGLLVLDGNAAVYAALAVCATVGYGALWTPATALLVDSVENRGLDRAAGFGLMSAAWPPGFAIGAAAGAAIAAATADAVPYLIGAVTCVLTLPLLRSQGGAPRGQARS